MEVEGDEAADIPKSVVEKLDRKRISSDKDEKDEYGLIKKKRTCGGDST